MAVIDQKVTNEYALYNGDSCEMLPTLRDASVGLSIYSPPFAQPGGGQHALEHRESLRVVQPEHVVDGREPTRVDRALADL